MKKTLTYTAVIGAIMGLSFYQVEEKKVIKEKEDLKEERTYSPIVQNGLQERIDHFLITRKRNCIKSILEDAEAYVDSTIINEINIKLLDTLIFPEKPLKPAYPGKITLDDSTSIAPKIQGQ